MVPSKRERPTPWGWGQWERVPGAVPLALAYGGALSAAEVTASYLPGAGGRYPSPEGVLLGMTMHTGILFTLLVHAAILNARSRQRLAGSLLALTTVPLIRVFSLSLPFLQFTIIQWLALISLPLLTAPFALMRLLDLRPSQVGLGALHPRGLGIQAAVGASGLGLGFVEYLILRPPAAWIPNLAPLSFITGAVVVTLSSGLAEELIFRGVLMHQTLEIMSPTAGILMVTGLFAVMHVGFLSPLDVAYVFVVGLYFAQVAHRTGSLYGVAACHSLANVVLYLLAPFVLH